MCVPPFIFVASKYIRKFKCDNEYFSLPRAENKREKSADVLDQSLHKSICLFSEVCANELERYAETEIHNFLFFSKFFHSFAPKIYPNPQPLFLCVCCTTLPGAFNQRKYNLHENAKMQHWKNQFFICSYFSVLIWHFLFLPPYKYTNLKCTFRYCATGCTNAVCKDRHFGYKGVHE